MLSNDKKKLVKLPSQHEEWPKKKGRRLDPGRAPPDPASCEALERGLAAIL